MQGEFSHVPVLLRECIEGLAIRPDGIYVDGTLGRAGHSLEIARRLTTGRLICIDQDEAAIEAAKVRLAEYMDRITLVRSNFSAVGEILRECLPRSWTTRSGAFPICTTPRWICGWIAVRR